MFKSIASNWTLNLLQMGVMLWLSRFVLQELGPDQNGLWVAIVSYTGILSLLILGVPMASVRAIATAVAQKDEEAQRRAIATCLGICLAFGAAAILAAGLLYTLFDASVLHGEAATALTPEALAGARVAFAILGAQVACGFVMRLPYGILEAHGEFLRRNVVMAGELLLRVVLTTLLLRWRPELPMLALVLVASMLFEFFGALAMVRARHPAARFSLRSFDRASVRPILSFSVFALLLNVGSLLAFRLDGLVITAYLPPASATDFDFGNKFFDPLTQFLIGIGAVIMPAATRLKTSGDAGELREVFLRWSKIALSIVLMVGTYLYVLGPAFLGVWVGPEYIERSGPVLRVLTLSFLFYLPVRGVALPLLMGIGKPRAPAIALLAMGLVNLAISLALVESQGIYGVALGTAIPNVLFALFALVLACRELSIGPRELFTRTLARPLLAATPLALLLAFYEHHHPVHDWPALILSGLVFVGLCLFAWRQWVRHPA
ncbi:MAG: polysaccharide biosynthesis C-terminal domain-containing protein [Planctomycetes bacterium]|nr:polysaccharide biosynthesis C-terminal domain-containing protein [Planctomycetota bacterium]